MFVTNVFLTAFLIEYFMIIAHDELTKYFSQQTKYQEPVQEIEMQETKEDIENRSVDTNLQIQQNNYISTLDPKSAYEMVPFTQQNELFTTRFTPQEKQKMKKNKIPNQVNLNVVKYIERNTLYLNNIAEAKNYIESNIEMEDFKDQKTKEYDRKWDADNDPFEAYKYKDYDVLLGNIENELNIAVFAKKLKHSFLFDFKEFKYPYGKISVNFNLNPITYDFAVMVIKDPKTITNMLFQHNHESIDVILIPTNREKDFDHMKHELFYSKMFFLDFDNEDRVQEFWYTYVALRFREKLFVEYKHSIKWS